MKWANTKRRTKAIYMALGFSIITLGVIIFSILSFKNVLTADVIIEKKDDNRIQKTNYGAEIMEKHPAPVDEIIKKLGFTYIKDAALESESRLLRIEICQKRVFYYDDVFDKLKGRNNIQFYWKDTGKQLDFRILYLGMVPPQVSVNAFLAQLNLDNNKFESSRFFIEKLVSNEYLTFDSF